MSLSSPLRPSRLPLFSLCLILLSQRTLSQSNAVETVSNHAPVLQVSAMEGYLPETAGIGTTVRISPSLQSDPLQILVNDEDLLPGMPPATYQYILTGVGATIFAVDQRGLLYLNVPNIDADPPNPSTYQLNVQAREVDTMPIRSSEPVTINIHIMDANDNSPEFEQPVYTASTAATGDPRPIVMVKAHDVDAGAFGNISYRISQVTNGAEGAFYFNEATHMLFANADLVPGERYQVVIEAKDGGDRVSQAIVIVLATDPSMTSSDPPPLPGMETFLPHPSQMQQTTPMALNSLEQEETIQTFVTEVSENTPANTVVVTLSGDAKNEQLYFNIVGGNEEGKFAINAGTGTITTVDEFDRERTAMYSLQIETRSRNPDQHLYWTLVQITVLDINDNAPHFVGTQPLRFSKSIDDLDELAPNMQIGRVEVEDLDADDNGRIELRVSPPMNRLFSISNDGVITVGGDFTAAHFGEHRLIIVARDHGDPPRETRGEVVINVYGTLITMATAAPTNEVFEYTSSIEEESPTQPDYVLQSITTPPPGQGNPLTTFSSFPNPSPAPAPPTIGGHPQFPSVVLPTEEQTPSPDYYSTEEQTQHQTSEEMQTSVAGTSPTQSVGPTTWETEPSIATTTHAATVPPPPAPIAKRLAPVFNPAHISVHVEENKAEVEIARVHASYPDGQPGQLSYVLVKGDPSLFAVLSFSGSVTLLRPLDAETDTSYSIQISTNEASLLPVDPSLSHLVSLTVQVDDVNDWIPAFETGTDRFPVPENTIPGTIIGQVSAFDQDRDDPNNRIRYRLVSAGGLEAHFAVNSDTGAITLSRPIDAFSGENVKLKIEASDSGVPAQSSTTEVLIAVVPTSSQVIPEGGPFSSRPTEGALQFSLRNYTTSVSESVRPPHLVQVLSINNKPLDSRFVMCNIVSGNYRGAFGVMAGNDGNCELRTQLELDRESVERYLLNITVTAGTQTDFSLVSVTVLDVNDNVPRFVYDNDLGLSTYFAGVASTAGAFTRVLAVKAEDADLGNSSVVNYALDPLSVHSKYFSISPFGEISTKQSMAQVLQKNRLAYFEIRVSACDSPISGQQLCSKADVVINVVTEAHRFRMITQGLNPQQLSTHEKDMVRSVRQFTGPCTLLNIEKMVENSALDNQARTDIYWYAVNPSTKKICKKHEFRKLFEPVSVQMIAGKVQPWFRLERVAEDSGEDGGTNGQGGIWPANWKTASMLLIGLAIAVAVLSLVGACAVLCYYTRYKSRVNIHAYNPQAYPPKMGGGTIYLPNTTMDPRFDKIYDTQMMQMEISDEDLTMKSGSLGATQPRGVSYRNYGRQHSSAYEGDFSIEESMYAINVPGRMDPVTKRIQTLVIPAPDYPATNRAGSAHNKSML